MREEKSSDRERMREKIVDEEKNHPRTYRFTENSSFFKLLSYQIEQINQNNTGDTKTLIVKSKSIKT
jgi:hypothetical protein